LPQAQNPWANLSWTKTCKTMSQNKSFFFLFDFLRYFDPVIGNWLTLRCVLNCPGSEDLVCKETWDHDIIHGRAGFSLGHSALMLLPCLHNSFPFLSHLTMQSHLMGCL
jgi:hypothetical protein